VLNVLKSLKKRYLNEFIWLGLTFLNSQKPDKVSRTQAITSIKTKISPISQFLAITKNSILF
jgi:hypothetical protein